MEQPTTYKFPLFANKNANDPDKFIDIAEFIVSAKTGVWKEQVEIVRNALAQSGRDSPPHTKAKGNLPAITLSVNCSTRAKDADVPMAEKYLGHTLLLQGDFDLKASLEICNELKQRLSNDQHLPFVSISPSGDGVKAALLVSVPAEIAAQLADPNKAREIHQGIAKGGNAYFLRTYGLENDKSVKDLFRLFFVLYDPEIYYNLNAIPLELDIDYFREEKPMPKAKAELPSNKENLLPNSNELPELPPNTAKWLKREVETQLERIRKATKGTRQKTTYGATIALAKFIPNGYLTEDYVREEVWKAVRENKTYKEDDHAERHSTIENGLTRGQSEHEEPIKLLTNEELHQPITAEYKFNNETYYYETTLSELVSVIDNLDLGDGELLKALFPDKIRLFREQNDGNGWLIYNGQHWEKSFIEIGKTLASAVRSIIMPHWDKIKTEISITQDKAWSRLEAKKTNGGFDNAKKSYRELISDSLTDYDTNHYYLNCRNGTFDLQSMKLISHRPEHQQMKCLPWEYDASAKCPKWRAFLNDVYEDNQEVIHFIQQFAGISLTGEITEHFCFFWGNGSNGKSTILMTLMDLLGDYGQMLDSKIFTGEADNASRERVKLLGARLAVAMEIRNNAQYNTQVLKSLSSQDKIVGEAKYQHPITFQPSHKLWIMGNHKPSVSDNSEGLARRLVYVPHNWRIPDAKVMAPFLVKEMFRKEMPGILNWSIDGWKDYCQRGRLLLIPEYLKEESKRYLEENTIQPAAVEFLLECDDIMFEKGNPNYIAQAKPLYETYVKWHNAYKKGSPITLTKFGDQLKTYGLVKYRTGKGNYYVGVMNHQDNEFNFSSEAKRAIRSNETTN